MATLLSHKIKEKLNKKDNTENKYCRICAEETCLYDDKWSKPCKCKGSIEWVHLSCLTTWIQHSNKLQCDMCLTPYKIVYKKEENHTYCDSFLNIVHPKIAPFLFTLFICLIIFDISYRLSYGTGNNSYSTIIDFFKIYFYSMMGLFFLLELYTGAGIHQDLIEMRESFGLLGMFFILPFLIYTMIQTVLLETMVLSNYELMEILNYE